MRFTLLFAFFLLSFQVSIASHNLAGQITCRLVGVNQYEITLTTYTDPAPANVDRFWADIEIWNQQTGTFLYKISAIPRANGPVNGQGQHLGQAIYSTVKKNIYVTTYTFPGQGAYLLRYFDPTRRADVKNIYNPENVNFYVETFFYLTNPLGGNNNTPILLNDPLDEACIGKIWTHNPGGYDPDGDSLHYSLVPSEQYDSNTGPYQPIAATGYMFPDNPTFGVSSLTIHPQTGVMTWTTPQSVGVYNIAYTVEEYRNGAKIGHVLRDMVIIVKSCNNNPPIVATITDTCVQAGRTLVFPFKAYEQDTVDSVYLSLNNANLGINGPFAVSNPATIQLTNPWGGQLPKGLAYPDTIKGNVIWNTTCDNIRTTPYQVDFYAHDNFIYYGASWKAMLSDHKAVSIFISPPAPKNLTLTKGQGNIVLNWQPSDCDNAVGYYVYRRNDGQSWNNDGTCCRNSPADMGYQLLAYVTGWANTTYTDNLVGVGSLYDNSIDYLVTAMFGNPAAPVVESCPTNNVGFSLKKDSLFIIKADVIATSLNKGKIQLAWTQPKKIDNFFKTPVSYKIYRANNNQYPAILIGTKPYQDTTFIDSLLNTTIRNYSYRISVFDADEKQITCFGIAQSNSIFLKTKGLPDKVMLDWKVEAGWENDSFAIYRKDAGSSFVFQTMISANSLGNYVYEDTSVVADAQYCYAIVSYGKHNSQLTPSLIINRSNESCAYTQLSEPPCTPILTATGDCNTYQHQVKIERLSAECDAYTEVFTLYYGLNQNGPFVPLQSLYATFKHDTTLTFSYHTNPAYYAGCYAISATNKYNTTSSLSTAYCVGYCPIFEMSNVFSPNLDGSNDWLTPVKIDAVLLRSIDIYDRWGCHIYQGIADAERLWNGYLSDNKTPANEGVYYYVIQYEELDLKKNIAKTKKGWVMLMR